jgi:DNA-binding LacI/PurR family transcriptional regulator
MLPGRRELASEYGVSRVTVERAITHLLADGTLRTDNRRGTFVAKAVAAESAVQLVELAIATVSGDNAGEKPSGNRGPGTMPITIGIIASLYLFDCDHLELNNYLVRTLIESMDSGFSEDGRQTRFYNRVVGSGQPLLSLEQSLAAAIADGVDAIVMIALGLDPAVVDASLAMLDARHTPIVCITSSELRTLVPHVFYDNYSAGYQAAQHLLHRNHSEILMVAPFTASWVQERLEGIRSAVEHAKLPAEAVKLYPATSRPWVNEEDPEILGYDAGIAAFTAGCVPSAVVCANDGVAFGFVRAAAEAGKAIGQEVAVVGFDNHPRSLSLGITSLRAPMEGMGREAARMLLREVYGAGTGFQVRLRWCLIARASTRATS